MLNEYVIAVDSFRLSFLQFSAADYKVFGYFFKVTQPVQKKDRRSNNIIDKEQLVGKILQKRD